MEHPVPFVLNVAGPRESDEKLLADVIRDEKDSGLPVEFTIPRRDFELGYFRVWPVPVEFVRAREFCRSNG